MRRFVIAQLTLVALILCTTADAAGADWGIQATPDLSGTPSAGLNAISCPATTCIAAGTYATTDGPQPLAELWDGTAWAQESIRAPGAWSGELAGVSCPSATECVAVGTRTRRSAIRTLVEQWDGASWSIMASPNLGRTKANRLTDVSCVSATGCTAVGYSITRNGGQQALIERWNGTRWAIQPAARPHGSQQSELEAVSCVPLGACFAVGSFIGPHGNARTLVQESTGGRWVVLATPGHSSAIGRSLNAVACTSATSCMAVGDYVNPSGYYRALAESWDGTGWTPTTVADPGRFNFLNGVACDAASSCVAVGQSGGNHSRDKPLVERWNALTWSVESAVAPVGQASSGLNGVVCPSQASCTAVGGYAERSGDDLTLALAGS